MKKKRNAKLSNSKQMKRKRKNYFVMSSHAKNFNFCDYLEEQTMFNLFRCLPAVEKFTFASLVCFWKFLHWIKTPTLTKDQLALNDVQKRKKEGKTICSNHKLAAIKNKSRLAEISKNKPNYTKKARN